MSNSDPWMSRVTNRIARAAKWRADAFEVDPSLRTLVRPKPGTLRNRTTPDEVDPATRKTHSPKRAQQRFEWADAYFHTTVDENKVFYESFSGNGALCNPRAVFEHLLNDPLYSHFQHVWALNNGESRTVFESEYSHLPNVSTVTTGTVEYWQQLSTAKYLFNNSTFPWKFSKRPQQIYINTWHGTPLKTMGYDSNEGAYGAANILRNFVQADYIISPNTYTTDTMLKSAYKLDGIFEGTILEYGYPRIDSQLYPSSRKNQLRQHLATIGLKVDPAKPLVVYAPTWRGDDFFSVESAIEVFEELARAFDDRFGDTASLLFKVHQRVYDLEKTNASIADRMIPNSIPTNEILGITDALISDYSSIWIDYLSLDKPLLFFMPDKEAYSSGRGLYFTQLPGPVLEDISSLMSELGSTNLHGSDSRVSNEYKNQHQDAKDLFCSLDNGNATEALVSRIFTDTVPLDTDSRMREVVISQNTREKLLIYLGGMRRNGISTSALNLLKNIDQTKYDISIWAPRPKSAPHKTIDSSNEMYESIPPGVRQFLRNDSHPASEAGLASLNHYLNDGDVDNHKLPEDARILLETEWNRCFGSSKFDYIIDFSGYAGFWSLILSRGTATKGKYVWAHNDLENDRAKIVNGRHPNDASLVSQYKAYQFFDGLVSVSPSLSAVNAKTLWPYVRPNGFLSVRNSLDIDRIQLALSGGEPFPLPSPASNDCAHTVSSKALIRSLIKRFGVSGLSTLTKQIELEDRTFSRSDVYHFISVGRLAPEKNQERLLQAFAICKQQVHSCTLTILGEGPLLNQLKQLSNDLGISNSVNFLGNQPNALSYMKRADLFVLSSDFEGQPMVFMESLSMGTPILTVDFTTVHDALPEGQGVIVPSTAEDLGLAMAKFASGELQLEVSFDPMSYNSEVLSELEAVFARH
jgi:CDP-glycerol glycerophosphotransferase